MKLSPTQRDALWFIREEHDVYSPQEEWVWNIKKATARALEARGLVVLRVERSRVARARAMALGARPSAKGQGELGCRITAAGRKALEETR